MRRIKFNHNQLTIPFGDKSQIALSIDGRERFFWFLVSVSVFSLLIYVYAINAAAHHIAVRQNLESEVTALNSSLGSLEFDSIALKNAITMEVASIYGFEEVREPLYVSRNSPATALTLNTVQQ